MDLKEIQNLIKFVANSGVAEVKLETGDVKITIRTAVAGTSSDITYIPQIPVQQNIHRANLTPSTTPIDSILKDENAKYITIKSPIIGTFYRKSSPEKPMFVEIGKSIKKGDILCVIEAMKLFNEIESEVSGKIIQVLVDDMSPVEFDQPLFLVDPA